MAQRAEPAQHRRDERPDQRTVAPRQFRKGRARGGAPSNSSSSGAAAAQHAVEDVGRDAAGGETRHIVGGARRASSLGRGGEPSWDFFARITSREREAPTEDLRRRPTRAK